MPVASIDRALHIAQTGLGYYTTALAVASENLSATGVTGFKKASVIGTDLPYTRYDPAGANTSSSGTKNPTGIELGMGVQIGTIARNFAQGDLTKTDAALDLAISGEGFFKVMMPDGTIAYTRAGAFALNATGQIVTQPGGYIVSPGISIPTGTTGVKISEDGTVFVQQAGQTVLTQIGQVMLTSFLNPAGLAALGDTLFSETEASGTPTDGAPNANGLGKIKQGYREASNSNTLEDVIELMRINKMYNFLIKVLTTAKEMSDQDARIGG